MSKVCLLLHGWLGDTNDFAPIFPFLEKNYDHIECLTYPGHGPGEDYSDFTGEATVELVSKSFEKLEREYTTIDVIGFSMGGALATYLANKYEFRKLVLLAPANRYFNFYLPFSKVKSFVKYAYELQKAYLKRDQGTKEQIKGRFKAILQDDLASFRFAKEKYLKPYIRQAYREFKSIIELTKASVKEIKNPCFIAWGKLDQLVPKESVDMLYELCISDKKELKIYEDLSHLLLLSSNCEELVTDIVKFLED
ncbi:MAG: alpha/beta fold hydrolase [Acholeplasmataceae bacterium]|nr:alpha/beta fold hydrolase [Acholeplasmataceae bacterium]